MYSNDSQTMGAFFHELDARNAAREKAKRKREETAKDLSPQQMHGDIIRGKGRWKALGILEWERKEAERKRLAEAEEIVPCEEPQF